MNSKDKICFELTPKMVYLYVLVAAIIKIWVPLQQGICWSIITVTCRRIIVEL